MFSVVGLELTPQMMLPQGCQILGALFCHLPQFLLDFWYLLDLFLMKWDNFFFYNVRSKIYINTRKKRGLLV